jgi:putative PIN family toxin of toxin-antitoxin system
MRLTLDTNILVSSLLHKHTPPYLLYNAWRNGNYDLVTSHAQLEEIRRVVAYPKLARYIKADEATIVISGLATYALIATNLPVIKASPDPDDNVIIATAVSGNCDYIVTGDKADLLALKKVGTVDIITARAAVEIVIPQDGST